MEVCILAFKLIEKEKVWTIKEHLFLNDKGIPCMGVGYQLLKDAPFINRYWIYKDNEWFEVECYADLFTRHRA